MVSKGRKLVITPQLLAERMSLPCKCGPQVKHVRCEESVTQTTAYYTPDFGRRVCQALLQGSSRDMVTRELNGANVLHEQFGSGLLCQCQHGTLRNMRLTSNVVCVLWNRT